MRLFTNFSAQTKLFFVFGMLALVAAIIAVTGITQAAVFQEHVAQVDTHSLALERSGRAQGDLAREQFAIKNALLSDKPNDWGQVYTYSGQFYDFLDSELISSPGDEQDKILQEIVDLRDQYDAQVEAVFDTVWEDDFDPEEALFSIRDNADPLATLLNERLEQLAALHQEEITKQGAQIRQSVLASASAGFWAILILAGLIVFGMYVTQQLTQPLQSLVNAIVAFQNNTYRPGMLSPYLLRQDEMGQLARAVDSMATSITESNRIKDQFMQSAERFIPTQYLEFLEKPAITEVNLGDHVAAEMAVMFSDIRGFTSASEKMSPQENFDFINEYLKLVSPVIQHNEGFIVKFLGDGMMAIFPYGADTAIQAGIEKQKKVVEFNNMLTRRGYPPVAVGIGVHAGHMMVGMIGEEQRMQGDAFSDNVNLTSRIEGLNKFFGTSMIVSADTLEGLPQTAAYKMRYLGQARVKGRQSPLALYEVYQGLPNEVVALKDAGRADFERGIAQYTQGHFTEAQQAFDAVLDIDPQDKTARYYLERCFEWAEQAAPPGWDGVLVMTDK